jgi:hypothetical protein
MGNEQVAALAQHDHEARDVGARQPVQAHALRLEVHGEEHGEVIEEGRDDAHSVTWR